MGESRGGAVTLGKRLKYARLQLAARRGDEVPKTELAAVTGVTGQSVARWEADQLEPSLATLRTLARHLEVDVAWLAFGPPYPAPGGGVARVADDEKMSGRATSGAAAARRRA